MMCRFLVRPAIPCRRHTGGESPSKRRFRRGTLRTLWNAEDRFRKKLIDNLSRLFETGDCGAMWNEDGYLYIRPRTDDVDQRRRATALSTGAI